MLKVLKDKNKAIVEGVNMVKKHAKPNPMAGIEGGIVEKEMKTAAERGVDLRALRGSGPAGAVLAADVDAAPLPLKGDGATKEAPDGHAVGTVWRIMAERIRHGNERNEAARG